MLSSYSLSYLSAPQNPNHEHLAPFGKDGLFQPPFLDKLIPRKAKATGYLRQICTLTSIRCKLVSIASTLLGARTRKNSRRLLKFLVLRVDNLLS